MQPKMNSQKNWPNQFLTNVVVEWPKKGPLKDIRSSPLTRRFVRQWTPLCDRPLDTFSLNECKRPSVGRPNSTSVVLLAAIHPSRPTVQRPGLNWRSLPSQASLSDAVINFNMSGKQSRRSDLQIKAFVHPCHFLDDVVYVVHLNPFLFR